MKPFDRVTTIYVAEEDRLQLTGTAADGNIQTIWLTQRLLLRLLPPLLQWLEGKSGDSLMRSVAQGFAQQAATAELTPQARVQALPDSAVWLAHAVDIKPTEASISLVFRSGGDQAQAALVLGATPLRQWLSIVHDAYLKAQWSQDVWPDWVSAAAQPSKPQAVVLH